MSYEVIEEDLRLTLEQFGQVEFAPIIKDEYSGQSKGFGFVEMPSKAEGQSAIDGLNGKELRARALNVNDPDIVSLDYLGAFLTVTKSLKNISYSMIRMICDRRRPVEEGWT